MRTVALAIAMFCVSCNSYKKQQSYVDKERAAEVVDDATLVKRNGLCFLVYRSGYKAALTLVPCEASSKWPNRPAEEVK